ncbi:CAAX amino terminal protease family protein [Lentilactobacillus rapi DSM 19907 = JCM 15042]|nr:CAAX amino terminal protease family protein [Lentilactobacillus rapi DSM 19907 = JCM 15042]
MLNLLLSLILINERRTVLNNLVKLPLIGLFPYSLGLSICLFGAPFISNIGISKWIILLIGLILFGVMLYPFLKVMLLSLQGIGWQIAGNITFMMTFYMASFSSQFLNFPTSISNPVLWLSFLGSFGIAGYAMKAWGYQFPQLKINSQVNFWWLGILIITALLNLGMSAGSWSRLFTDFKLVLATHSLIMLASTIVWVGIKEEFMFRYLFLWPLLTMNIKSDQKRIVWATLISSGIFGLFHAGHLFAGQGLLQTFFQVFSAFGIGMLFTVITLYTGTLWIGIILHLLIDLITFPTTSAGIFSGPLTSYQVEFILITRIIELIVVFLILKNKHTQAAFMQTLRHVKKDPIK